MFPDFEFFDSDDLNSKIIEVQLPRTVIQVSVVEGEAVKKVNVLIIIESMKMENEIIGDRGCVISKVPVKVRDYIKKNQELLSIKT